MFEAYDMFDLEFDHCCHFRQAAILASEVCSLGYFPAKFGGDVAIHSGRYFGKKLKGAGFGQSDNMLEHEVLFQFLQL